MKISKLVPLSQAPKGANCLVESLELHGAARTRLEEMGITCGAKLKILRYAPAGDPLELQLRGYLLCLRKETATHILVRVASL